MAEAGREYLVRYDVPGDPEWHARLLLARVDADGYWIVLMPNGDLCGEILDSDRNENLVVAHLRAP